MTRNPRGVVIDNLIEIIERGKPSHVIVKSGLDLFDGLSKSDRSFIKKMTIGTLERKLCLDEIIDRYSSVPVSKQKPAIRNILRFGIYQLLFTSVSDPAACNESVILCKKYGFNGLSGFVNGVLRTVAREKNKLLGEIHGEVTGPADGDNESFEHTIKRLCFKYSMPEWITSYFLDQYGLDKTIGVFEYFFRENITTICCNMSSIEPYKLTQALKEKLSTVIPIPGTDRCLKISGYDSLIMLDEFESGLFWVQDYSSVLASNVPDIDTMHAYLNERIHAKADNRLGYAGAGHENEIRILDLCASPGGKTLNMADRFKNAGLEASFTACDISDYKLSMIKDNIERLGFDNITAVLNDAAVFNPAFEDGFDVLIADLPCSGLGVIGKKPDIKYNMTAGKQEELAALQRSILDNAVRYLHEGGYLLYSTCTVNRAENEDNVDHIISKGFEPVFTRQILPGELDSDGFFYSLLKKKQERKEP